MVDGHSMEPLLHQGDLVIARRARSYALGDLVVTRVAASKGVHSHVIHRLVSGDAESGWKTQGDSDSWIDPWVVPQTAITGRYWIAVSGSVPAAPGSRVRAESRSAGVTVFLHNRLYDGRGMPEPVKSQIGPVRSAVPQR